MHNRFIGNPLSIYTESFISMISNIIILMLFPIYSKNFSKGQVLSFLPLFMMIAAMLYVREDIAQWTVYILITLSMLFIMQGFSAKLFQIREIWKLKSTGSVSFITYFLLFMGAVARLITILIEGKENTPYLVHMGQMIILNGVVLAQFLIYKQKGQKT